MIFRPGQLVAWTNGDRHHTGVVRSVEEGKVKVASDSHVEWWFDIAIAADRLRVVEGVEA